MVRVQSTGSYTATCRQCGLKCLASNARKGVTDKFCNTSTDDHIFSQADLNTIGRYNATH